MTYDRHMVKVEKAGLGPLRSGLVAGAGGRVLEVGAGTGANLPFYGRRVESLTLTEAEPPMLRRLEKRVRQHGRPAIVLRAPAEDLPFEDDSFDVAVSTLVLCGVSDQPRALRELHRVLRPGGALLFIEHVRSDEPRLARKQDRFNGLNRFVAGCECNRPTLNTIKAAGFEVVEVHQTEMPKAPAFLRPVVVGTAAASSVPADVKRGAS
jgi:ubiquinone/menaquinone biosynthesis C-methylase UbiE